MTYADTMAAMNAKRKQIEALQGEMRALQAKVEPEVVQDYVLDGWDGPVRLSELFGDKHDLILIHNMGKGCSSCTMWADGFNGVYDHLASRAAFALASPNPVDVQRKLAAERGWRFPMVSYGASRLAEDMGFRHRVDYPKDDALGGWNPGVSIFRRDGDRIVRVSDAEIGPGDGLCVVYSLFDLIPGSSLDWEPKYKYA
jgi:predicted dithiol-disulfide oxidoreductase (DUF899 family)